MELYASIVDQYEDFAAYAAADSPCFADWATRVAADAEVQAWVAELPPIKQQPNLVFAAARWHGVAAPGRYTALRQALLGDDGTIVATISRRSTQTNEVNRLATLAPVFARIAAESHRPLALLEAGASAGVCLYPDRYTYRYLLGPEKTPATWTPGTSAGELTCRVKGTFEVPTGSLEVAWRGGLDLAPVDVDDEDATRWLETLVWPEQDERRAWLRTALEVARHEPSDVRAGDALTELPALVDEASKHGEVVVFHTAVVAYLEPEDRRRFADLMSTLVASGRCRWVSNESKTVLPTIAATGPDIPDGHPTFVLGLDGQEMAWTHGHGRAMTWHDTP